MFFRFIILILFIYSTSAWCDRSSSGLYFSLAGKGMMGTSGSKDDSYAESRSHYVYGGETILGWRLSSLLLGVAGEYNLWKQKTKPSEVGNTNLAGNQLNVSPVIGFAMGKFLLLGKSVLYSTFTLDKENAAGEKVRYISPALTSITVQLNYKLAQSTFVGLEYSSVTYGKTDVAGTETKLSSDEKISYGAWGVICGFMF